MLSKMGVFPWLVLSMSSTLTVLAEQYLFDFTQDSIVTDWTEQSDTVRTVGLSKAVIVLHENTGYRRALFFSLLNLQDNGAGFAGVRIQDTWDLSDCTEFQIQCRAQGEFNGYKIVLRHKNLDSNSDNTYEGYFDAPIDEFGVVSVPFSDFAAYFRGLVVADAEALDTSNITTFGVQIYGGVYRNITQSGPNTLEIDWIKAV